MTAAKLAGMPNGPGTTKRTIRVADDLWLAVVAASKEQGESASDVARRAFTAYLAERSREREPLASE